MQGEAERALRCRLRTRGRASPASLFSSHEAPGAIPGASALSEANRSIFAGGRWFGHISHRRQTLIRLSGSHRAAGFLLAQRNGPANWDGSYKKPRKERRPKPTPKGCPRSSRPYVTSGDGASLPSLVPSKRNRRSPVSVPPSGFLHAWAYASAGKRQTATEADAGVLSNPTAGGQSAS